MVARDDGREFEEQVARWLRRVYSAREAVVTVHDLCQGKASVRPYQVDVSACFRGINFWDSDIRMWVECKYRTEASIKRDVIEKQLMRGEDVFRGSKVTRKPYFNALMVVSNQSFEVAALKHADDRGVMCVRFNGRNYLEQNSPGKSWLGNPAWLVDLVKQLGW